MHIARFNIYALLATLATALLMMGPVHAGGTCGCDIAPAQVRTYDAALVSADINRAGREHAPWGVAVAVSPQSGFLYLSQNHWLTGYDPVRRLPLWVAYRLTARDLSARRKRTQCFRPDPRLDTGPGGTSCASYRGDGLDRGHMVASADMTRSEQAMVNTYVFSNIAHQHPGFNRTVWRDLETRVRAMARLRGEIYVMTGAIFDADHDGLPDPASMAAYPPAGAGKKADVPNAAVATHFYKIVFVPGQGATPPEIRAWLLRHENIRTSRAQSKRMLAASEVPLDIVEDLSGLDIAPLLNDVRLVRVAD